MPRPRSPTLTDAKARVMSVLWKKERATVADVVGTLKRKRPVSYSTVRSKSSDSRDKGYVATRKSRGRSSTLRSSTRGRRGGGRCATW